MHRHLSSLTRIIHERFCCNHGFAAAASLTAGGLATRSVNILFQVCLPPVVGSALKPASPTSTSGASPLVESPRKEHTPFRTPRRSVASPRGCAHPSRVPSRRFRHEPSRAILAMEHRQCGLLIEGVGKSEENYVTIKYISVGRCLRDVGRGR